ncbi:LCP family protein [Streptomyces sp. NPDC059597]|uniref:LCP family protein n=1 Tax=Streptomyces sp. NPDC059597 TaxID=3346879 RepID=UPI0036B9B99A
MSAESTPAPGRRSKGHRRKPRSTRRKALLATAWAAAGVVVLGGAGAGYVYFKLNGNLTSVDINQILGGHRPAKGATGSENILVLGSDTRAGANHRLGGGAADSGARADTAMIVHVYKGHKKATVVSVPRDTLIDRPACADAKGHSYPAARGVMFNSAYATGGAPCAVKTVESLTGLRMDHYLEVDFAGFQRLVDDLGGVPVTTTQAIHDPQSHLNLPAGTHTLDGTEALGLVRTRHGVGDGSDLGRIQLQQAFVKALMDQVKHVGVFSDPKRLYDLADTATKSVTTDSDLGSVNSLADFASGLKGVKSSRIQMVTMPVQYDPANPNRVLLEPHRAAQVWKALKEDRRVPASATADAATGNAGKVIGTPQG